MIAVTGDQTKQHKSSPRRSVRSFVRRVGRLTPGQQRALDEFWPEYGVDYTPATLNLSILFAEPAPTVLEIGFGNGESLVTQASQHRELNYLGIEVHEPGVGHCIMHAEAAQLSNLRVICHDAIDVLSNQIADNSLTRMNLYFPDPWPKKRHHKRRIVQPTFLALTATKLTDNGTLHIATDWSDYAQHIDDAVAVSGLFEVDERREHGGERALDRPITKFERRGLRRGHTIFDWRLKKI